MEYFGFNFIKVNFTSDDSTGKRVSDSVTCFQNLFVLDVGVDIPLKLQDGSTVGLHKFMLQAQAPDFLVHLKSNEKIDMTSDTFNIIKIWIYTGHWKPKTDVTASVLLDLYYWSDKLTLEWLKWKSLHLLYSMVKEDITTFLLVFEYASEKGLEILERLCLTQIKNYQFSDHQFDQLNPALLKMVCPLRCVVLTSHR